MVLFPVTEQNVKHQPGSYFSNSGDEIILAEKIALDLFIDKLCVSLCDRLPNRNLINYIYSLLYENVRSRSPLFTIQTHMYHQLQSSRRTRCSIQPNQFWTITTFHQLRSQSKRWILGPEPANVIH